MTVEFDSPRHALHLFADPPEADVPQANASKVRYFGPGVHRPGKIQLHSGETLYIAGGAVVYTAVSAHGATGVRILGRGIIDTSEYERGKGGGCIRLSDCSDVKIDGVILRDPDVSCLSAFGCRNLEISNVKLIGLWRYNADGIDICNCQDVVVRNSFVRSFDDAIVLKGLDASNRHARSATCAFTAWCSGATGGERLRSGPRPHRPKSRISDSATATSSARRISPWTSSAGIGCW